VIDDRDYMREPEEYAPRRFGVRWSLTVIFLIAYAVVFFAENVLFSAAPLRWVSFHEHFALSNHGLAQGFVWQLVTYQFMHANFLHLFFNGWAIYTFGLELEARLGRKRFATLMLSSGVIGGVFQALLTLVAPHFFPDAPVVGASACAFGLVAVFALLYPERDLTMLIFFVIPVTVPAKALLYVSAGLAVAGIVFAMFIPSGNVAHAAHLGGMAMGWFYARKMMRRFSAPADRITHAEPDEADGTQFTAREVDAILDKINASGIKSLTAKERAVLETARKKISRR
jgi:membrane associated rhomboid family serine protease